MGDVSFFILQVFIWLSEYIGEKAVFSKRKTVVLGDDDVVDEGNVDFCEGTENLAGSGKISAGRDEAAAGMVMGENREAGVVLKSQ